MQTLVILGGILFASLLFHAVAVRLGMWLVNAGSRSWGRAWGIVLMTIAIGVAAQIGLSKGFTRMNIAADLELPIVIGVILVAVLLTWGVTAKLALTTYFRGAAIWLVQLAASAAMVPIVLYGIKPHVVEAFVVPTNSMAPSIVGWHSDVACPHCGSVAVLPRHDPAEVMQDLNDPRPTTCPTCGKFGKPTAERPPLMGPDRILVNKLQKPERWDIIEFRYPRDPQLKYVDRLVGLPGETVFIEDGAVWIDGVKTPLPESVGKWKYSTEFEDGKPAGQLGTRETPWKLGPNEYCVLGDFGWMSSDSRFWGPVPAENVEGVVTLRYWPPARWGLLR